jgi:ribonuclease D
LCQFSLGHLVEKYLGVKLQKGAQKANWALRPLTERMERYARNDTHYLKPLADKLKPELEAKGRLAWHQEFCARLIVDSTRGHSPDMDTVWRLKGSHLLERLGLAILRELWRWRESEAIQANKPPFFVMSHESLVEVAAASAAGKPIELFLPKHISERRLAGLLSAIAHGFKLSPDQHPGILRPISRRPSAAERHRFIELQKHRDARATALGLDPTLIASRATLSDLAHNWEKHSSELMTWQRALLA